MIKLKCWCLCIFESLSQLTAVLAGVATDLPREHEHAYPENPCDLRSGDETTWVRSHTAMPKALPARMPGKPSNV